MEAKQGFDSWALVELMGHQRIAGKVTEAEIGGSKFVRVDVPEMPGKQPLTKYLGPASIYAITPLTEESALSIASRIDSAPISTWDARRLIEIAEKQKREAPKELSATSPFDTNDDDSSDDDSDDSEDEGPF